MAHRAQGANGDNGDNDDGGSPGRSLRKNGLVVPVRCALYRRQSADPRDDLSLCQVQYEACRAFVKARHADGLRLIKDRSTNSSPALAGRPAEAQGARRGSTAK